MRLNSCLPALAVAVCLLLPGGESAGAVVKPAPSADPVNLGDALYVEVRMQNLGYYSLGGFHFALEYDPAILTYDSHTLTDELGDLLAGEAVDLSGGDLGGGRIDLGVESNLTDFSGQADTFPMATVHFQAVGLGTSWLLLEPSRMVQGNGDPLLYVLYGGSVEVVPAPTAVVVLLLGAGALLTSRSSSGGIRSRK